MGWLGQSDAKNADVDSKRVLRDLEIVLVPRSSGNAVWLSEVATVGLRPAPRRGVLEKDGNEVTGGGVLMRQGENTLEVTRRLKDKIQELQTGLPPGVRIVPFYDRVALIRGAIGTVTGTLMEAILTATVCVLLVLLHFRTSFVIALTLPLAALASFLIMWVLRRLGIADIQTNIMSLAGIAISIGVLVDSSIVMAENVMHRLQERFGDQPVTGDVREIVLSACRTVGRPIFFLVVVMLLSFLPVFALGGIEGKVFRPLAFAKCFALVSVAVLAVTLVPALCTLCIRGRLRGEMDSWVVRGAVTAYASKLSQIIRSSLIWSRDRPTILADSLYASLTEDGSWPPALSVYSGTFAPSKIPVASTVASTACSMSSPSPSSPLSPTPTTGKASKPSGRIAATG